MINKTILMGRLTANPDLRQTPNGTSVATFSLAIPRNYNKDITDFINIVAWRQTADFVSKYFEKGQLVVVEGSTQTRSYEDKKGNKRVAVEVVAEQVHFAESKKNKTDKNTNTPSDKSLRSEQQMAHHEPLFEIDQNMNIDDYDNTNYYDVDYDDPPF